MDDAPDPILGGSRGHVTRVGGTVHRPAGEWTPAVHRLLRQLGEMGVPGVPRPIGLTDDGAEVLTFVEGAVPSYPMPAWVWSGTALRTAADLLRRVHDATVGMDMTGPWRSPVRQPAEVVCHNDFAPYNLAFGGDRVVGAIDWDYASPGPRVWDLAYLAYRIVPLSSAEWGGPAGAAKRSERLRRLLDAYGSSAEPAEVLHVLRDRLRALAAFTDEAAQRVGDPALHADATLYRRDSELLGAG